MKKEILTLLVSIVTLVAYSQEYKFGKVSKEALQEKVYPLDSTANAAYLYRYRKTFFKYNQSSGFRSITVIKERVKVYNKDGINLATQNIRYYHPKNNKNKEKITELKAYTFNIIKGKIKKEKLTNSEVYNIEENEKWSAKKFTLSNVKEGSVIEWSYKITSPFISIKDLQFQFNIPVKQIDYEIAIPEFYKYSKMNKGYYHVALKSKSITDRILFKDKARVRTPGLVENGGGSIKTVRSEQTYDYKTLVDLYKGKNIPALKNDEPYVANIQNYRGGVKYELTAEQFPNSRLKLYTTTWEKVAKAIYRSPFFGGELAKKNYFKDDLSALLNGNESNAEKIFKIFNFIKVKMKWNEFYGKYVDKGVKKAYKNGLGNVSEINLILTSMLRSVGVDANPLLISTKSNGVPLFPTINGFDYVATCVTFDDGNIMFLDATNQYNIPGVLPDRLMNWKGRLIRENGNSNWVNLMPRKYSESTNFMSVKMNDDMSFSGMIRTVFKQSEAVNFRMKNNHVKEDFLITNLEERFNIEVEEYKVTNKDKIYKPITRVIKFLGEDFTEVINGKIYISPLLFLKRTNNPFKLKERKFPIDYGVPIKNKSSVSLKLPKGYKVELLPESKVVALSNNAVVFGYKVVSGGDKVKVVSQFQINSPIITPEYYQELKELYSQMIKKQTEKIVLVKE